MPRVKTVVNGQPYVEELSFEQLSQWSAGRWQAGQGDQSDNVMHRAQALIEATQKGKTVIRDEGSGELQVVSFEEPKAPSTPAA